MAPAARVLWAIAAVAVAVAAQFSNHTLPAARTNRTAITAMAIGGCGPTGKLKRFAATVICVQIADQVAAFDVTVDAMHAVAFLGTFDLGRQLTEPGAVLPLAVGLQSVTSDDPTYSTASQKIVASVPSTELGGLSAGRRFFTTYTAVVQLVKGEPSSITFDDGCFFCDSMSSSCATNAVALAGGASGPPSSARGCFLAETECDTRSSDGGGGVTPSVPTGSACDLKVFVVWTGTDVDGTFLTSAGRRFSRYRQYGLQLPSMWQSLKGVASEAASRLNPVRDDGVRGDSAGIPGGDIPRSQNQSADSYATAYLRRRAQVQSEGLASVASLLTRAWR